MTDYEITQQAVKILCEQCAGRDYCDPSSSCDAYQRTIERLKGKKENDSQGNQNK